MNNFLERLYKPAISLLALVVMSLFGLFIYQDFTFIFEYWFVSGFVMLILLSFIDQPNFSRDSDILINSFTAFLSLLAVQNGRCSISWWFLIGICLLLSIISFALLIARAKDSSYSNKSLNLFSKVLRIVARPESLFSLLFMWGAITSFGIDSIPFWVLFFVWLVIIFLDLPWVSKFIIYRIGNCSNNNRLAIGEVIGIDYGNIYTVKIFDKYYETISPLDNVVFVDNNRKRLLNGLIFKIIASGQSQYAKVIVVESSRTGKMSKFIDLKEGFVYFSNNDNNDLYKDTEDNIVGFVFENTTINKLRFVEFDSFNTLNRSDVVRVTINNHKVYYQISDGSTKKESIEANNNSDYIIVEATQLGEWNDNKGCFSRYKWLPKMGFPVFLHNCTEKTEEEFIQYGTDEFKIGKIKNSSFPVTINKRDCILYHTAILGVTGSGKSVFTRWLIDEVSNNQTKVIIVDITGEYKQKNDNIFDLVNDTFEDGENLDDKVLRKSFREAINQFINSDNNISVIEPLGFEYNASLPDYLKLFFIELFDIAKENKDSNRQICVVLEEAHTVIPEGSSMGYNSWDAKAAVACISQIALQGRKYNIGFIIVAQRTANVSKTVLTQCNSIISFRSLDNTAKDFMKNYVGDDFVGVLSGLENQEAVVYGKAFRSNAPQIVAIKDLTGTCFI